MHTPVHAFKLSKQFLTQYKGKQPAWGFEGLGYVVSVSYTHLTLPTILLV